MNRKKQVTRTTMVKGKNPSLPPISDQTTLSFEQKKQLINQGENQYTDEEIKLIDSFLDTLIIIDYQLFMRKKERYLSAQPANKSSKIIPLNLNTDEKEKSSALRPSIYRRAS